MPKGNFLFFFSLIYLTAKKKQKKPQKTKMSPYLWLVLPPVVCWLCHHAAQWPSQCIQCRVAGHRLWWTQYLLGDQGAALFHLLPRSNRTPGKMSQFLRDCPRRFAVRWTQCLRRSGLWDGLHLKMLGGKRQETGEVRRLFHKYFTDTVTFMECVTPYLLKHSLPLESSLHLGQARRHSKHTLLQASVLRK